LNRAGSLENAIAAAVEDPDRGDGDWSNDSEFVADDKITLRWEITGLDQRDRVNGLTGRGDRGTYDERDSQYEEESKRKSVARLHDQ
jgi:hypothetical protein